MAEQDEAAAEALRGMNEAPDPPRAPGNQFQHDMGQSESPAPAVSGGQGDAQTTTELSEKDMAARAIHYGCPESASNLKRWAANSGTHLDALAWPCPHPPHLSTRA